MDSSELANPSKSNHISIAGHCGPTGVIAAHYLTSPGVDPIPTTLGSSHLYSSSASLAKLLSHDGEEQEQRVEEERTPKQEHLSISSAQL